MAVDGPDADGVITADGDAKSIRVNVIYLFTNAAAIMLKFLQIFLARKARTLPE